MGLPLTSFGVVMAKDAKVAASQQAQIRARQALHQVQKTAPVERTASLSQTRQVQRVREMKGRLNRNA